LLEYTHFMTTGQPKLSASFQQGESMKGGKIAIANPEGTLEVYMTLEIYAEQLGRGDFSRLWGG